MTLTWNPVLPPLVIVALGAALFIVLGWGTMLLSRRLVPARWRWGLAGYRVVLIVLFLICLLRPSVSWKRTQDEGPTLLVLADVSAGMQMTDTRDGRSRLADTVGWLEQSGLANDLSGTGRVHWFQSDRLAYQTSREQLATGAEAPRQSQYSDALLSAWEQVRARTEGGATRVLLLADGNDRSQRDVVETARNLGITIDVLAPEVVEQASGGAGIARVVAVQSPRRVLLGSESRFQVTVTQSGLANQMLELQLRLGGEVVATSELQFAAAEREKQVDLIFRPTQPGFFEYEIGIEGFKEEKDRKKMTVQVISQRYEVVFLEDSWRWEFKFLRRMMEDDPGFAFSGFLTRGDGAYAGFADSDRQHRLTTFPRNMADLNGFDMIILGDVDPRRWSAGLAESVRDLVVNKGRSLIVLAGPRIGQLAASPELGDLLPVEISARSGSPLPGPVRVDVPAIVRDTPFFHSPSAAIWQNLPELDRIYAPVHKKPAATILLEAPQISNDYGRLIVAAEQQVGRGRVLYIGTDTLWKWQTAAPDAQPGVTPYALFWQQTLRAMAPHQISGAEHQLRLQAEKNAYEIGETIILSAAIGAPTGKATMEGTARLPAGGEVPISFTADPSRPGYYTSDFEASQNGSYLFTAQWRQEGRVVAEAQIALDAAEPGDSLDQSLNLANLSRIASGTGGKLIDRGERASWPLATNLQKTPVTRQVHFELWDNSSLLILLVLMMGGDWALRLRKGFI